MKKTILLALSLTTLFFTSCNNDEDEMEQTYTSSLTSSQLSNYFTGGDGYYTYTTTNEKAIGQNYINFHNHLSSFWGTTSTFYFVGNSVNINRTNNAVASTTGGKHYILMGNALVNNLLPSTKIADFVDDAFVLAHEHGHIAQRYLGYYSNANNILGIELSADMLSGYYLGRKNGGNATWTQAATAFNIANSVGGNDHGSGSQRESAVRLGFVIAKNGSRAFSSKELMNAYENLYPRIIKGEKFDQNTKVNGREVNPYSVTGQSEEMSQDLKDILVREYDDLVKFNKESIERYGE